MIDKIFKTQGQNVVLDDASLQSVTDFSFLQHVKSRLTQPITGLRTNGDNRHAHLYFKCGSQQYSFSFDKRQQTLLFNEVIKGQWRFIVGHKK
ncbi:hypothetical protein D3C74_212610 [compost metagenome]